jgi:O-antigen ligase
LVVTIAILGAALFVALRLIGGFGGVSYEVATLNSRRAFWTLSWSGIQERPLFGWGWMAAWRSPDFFNLGLVVPDWNIVWSHNGYHDVLLGGGAIGGALFLLYVFASLRKIQAEATVDITFRVLIAAFVLTAATQESFFVGSHFMWVILVAALTSSAASKKSVNKEHTS